MSEIVILIVLFSLILIYLVILKEYQVRLVETLPNVTIYVSFAKINTNLK